MKQDYELILLESDGVIGKYLSTKDNSIVEAIGTIAVPRDSKVSKYRGTIIWSQDIPITEQIISVKKILQEYLSITNKEMLQIAREKTQWTFGDFFGVDAARILERAQTYHLNIEMVDVDSGIKLTI